MSALCPRWFIPTRLGAVIENQISFHSWRGRRHPLEARKHDQGYFADGMAEEIIDRLANAPELRVPARESSFYFRGKATKIAQIARELAVANVLEGSVRKSGSRRRVVAHLGRAENGYQVWSESYDRDLQDVSRSR